LKTCIYLFKDKATPIIFYRSHAPEHEPNLDDCKTRGKVELVHEELTEKYGGKYQPIAKSRETIIRSYVGCHGVIGWDYQA
jgi:hypothetical protein